MALTNTSALTAEQVDYLNGEGAHPSPFHGSEQVMDLALGTHVENLREDLLDLVLDSLKITAGATLSILAGVITPTNSLHATDTEAAAASDNLDNITATAASKGSVLFLQPASGGRTIVIRHNQGSSYSNIYCPGGVNVSLADTNDFALLVHNGTVWDLVWANTLVAHEAYVRAALAAATATVGFNTQSVDDIVNATLSGSLNADSHSETTTGVGVSVMKQVRHQHGGARNVETLAAGKVLVAATDPQYQNLDPGGASRTVTLPANEDGLFYWIYNSADVIGELLTVQTSAPATIVTLEAHEGALVFNNGTAWALVLKTYVDFGTQGVKLDKVDESTTGAGVSVMKQLRNQHGGARNVETLAAGKTLVAATDPQFQNLDPGGASRTVTLPANEDGLWYWIYNSADLIDELLTVQTAAPVTVVVLNSHEGALVVNDGSSWAIAFKGYIDFGAIGLRTDYLRESTTGRSIGAINAFRFENGGAYNVETLAAGKVLTVADAHFQRYDPDGVNRTVTLPAESALTDGMWFCISNEANALGELITVQDDTPASIYALDPREMAIFVCNGTNWVFAGRSLCDFGFLGLETDKLSESTSGAGISAQHALCIAEGGGVNEEVLAGTKTLVVTDAQFQRLDPDGANRNVVLPALKAGLWYRISNYGGTLGETLTVQNPTPATVRVLEAGESGFFVSTGAAWFYLGGGLVDFGAPGIKTDSIDESTAGAAISLVKALCMAEGGGVNAETLAAGKTLVVTDAQFQALDPDGTPRIVTLPAVKAGLLYVVFNTGGALGETLDVQNPAAASLRILDAGEFAIFASTGAAWSWLGSGRVDFGANGLKTDILEESTAGAAISALKALRLREGNGINIQTLAGAKVIVNTEAQFHVLDPDGVSRDVTLPAIQEGLFYWIFDNGGTLGETLVVKNPAAATLATLDAGQVGLFVCSAAAWAYAGPALGTDFAAVAAALAAASASIDVNAQSILDANVVQLNTLNESTAGVGISLTAGVEIIGVPQTISTAIAFNTVSGNLFAKPAGETWLIHSVWFKTAVDWDGDGTFIVGDATDADGFLVMANASLDPAYDETAGLVGWPPGTRGLRNSNEGVYLTNAGVPQSFISLPGGNIVFANTPGTSSAGSGTLYMQYTRLP